VLRPGSQPALSAQNLMSCVKLIPEIGRTMAETMVWAPCVSFGDHRTTTPRSANSRGDLVAPILVQPAGGRSRWGCTPRSRWTARWDRSCQTAEPPQGRRDPGHRPLGGQRDDDGPRRRAPLITSKAGLEGPADANARSTRSCAAGCLLSAVTVSALLQTAPSVRRELCCR